MLAWSIPLGLCRRAEKPRDGLAAGPVAWSSPAILVHLVLR